MLYEVITGVSDGLAHDRVNAAAIDDAGFVWAGTDGGLSRLEPATGRIRNFFVQHGLPDNEVMALATAPNGDLRITSYNVCYTKLLRAAYAGFIPARPTSGGRL